MTEDFGQPADEILLEAQRHDLILLGKRTFFSQLADDTGGIYFATFNRFLDPLRDISRYNTGYYLVSFRSQAPAGERGYRNFEVKSKDRKVRVKARRGYSYGPR